MDDGLTCLDRLDGLDLDQTSVSPALHYIQVPARALEGIVKGSTLIYGARLTDSNVLSEGEAGRLRSAGAEKMHTSLILGVLRRRLALRDGSPGQQEDVMKSRVLAFGLLLFWIVGTALAQNSANPSPSLAELARKERANRLKVKMEHSVRIWNNDNLPRRPAGEGPTAAAGMSPVPVSPEPPESLEAAAGGAHDEKYYRDQMSKLRERLELHQRQLAVLHQKQAQGQLQYYADPNKTLQEEFSRSEINKKNDEVAQKEKEIAEDEKAIQDLQDQLRREGHPAGWLR